MKDRKSERERGERERGGEKILWLCACTWGNLRERVRDAVRVREVQRVRKSETLRVEKLWEREYNTLQYTDNTLKKKGSHYCLLTMVTMATNCRRRGLLLNLRSSIFYSLQRNNPIILTEHYYIMNFQYLYINLVWWDQPLCFEGNSLVAYWTFSDKPHCNTRYENELFLLWVRLDLYTNYTVCMYMYCYICY